jgi:hypothetical protein
MKKAFTYFLLILVLFSLVALVVGCTEQGTVYHNSTKIIIHGKEYALKAVVPCDDCHAIWIMYPVDSTSAQPFVVNYPQQSGKSTVNQTVVTIP